MYLTSSNRPSGWTAELGYAVQSLLGEIVDVFLMVSESLWWFLFRYGYFVAYLICILVGVKKGFFWLSHAVRGIRSGGFYFFLLFVLLSK